MRRLSHPVTTFVVAVLVVIGVGVGVLAVTTQSTASFWHGGGTALTRTPASALSKVALRIARVNGDPSPTSVVVVASTREQALPVVFRGEMVNGATGRCYVIEMLGSFTPLSSPPRGAPSPKGSVLTAIVNASTFQIEDLSVGNVVSNLTSLGRVFALRG